MPALRFIPSEDAKKAEPEFFGQRFMVLQVGPCDPQEFEQYEKYGLPRNPERLKLPIYADRYVIGPELTQCDAYYALCLEENFRDRTFLYRILELSEKLPISKKKVQKVTPLCNGREIISLEVIL